MKKNRKKKRQKKQNQKQKLRSGSKAIKNQLLSVKPYCDICGSDRSLQLHHIYLIRHGFSSKLEHCVLLCPTCHAEFHHRFDRYLDKVFAENQNTDFLEIYKTLRNL